jgi:site-specific recombinase XerD
MDLTTRLSAEFLPTKLSGFGIPSDLAVLFFANYNSNKTSRGYFLDTCHFIDFMKDHFPMITDVKEVRSSHVVAYRKFMESLQYAPNTVARRLTAIGQFYTFLRREGFLAYNPTESVKRPKTEVQKPTEALDDEEAEKVIGYLNTLDGLCPKRLAVLILLSTGIRRAEVLSLKFKDFYQHNEKSFLRVVGKGRKEVIKLLPDWMAQEVISYRDHISAHSEGDLSDQFIVSWIPAQKKIPKRVAGTSISEYIKVVCRAVGITKRISPHSLRASYITSAFFGGMDGFKIQEDAGHASINTTISYKKRVKSHEDSPVNFIPFLQRKA